MCSPAVMTFKSGQTRRRPLAAESAAVDHSKSLVLLCLTSDEWVLRKNIGPALHNYCNAAPSERSGERQTRAFGAHASETPATRPFHDVPPKLVVWPSARRRSRSTRRRCGNARAAARHRAPRGERASGSRDTSIALAAPMTRDEPRPAVEISSGARFCTTLRRDPRSVGERTLFFAVVRHV